MQEGTRECCRSADSQVAGICSCVTWGSPTDTWSTRRQMHRRWFADRSGCGTDPGRLGLVATVPASTTHDELVPPRVFAWRSCRGGQLPDKDLPRLGRGLRCTLASSVATALARATRGLLLLSMVQARFAGFRRFGVDQVHSEVPDRGSRRVVWWFCDRGGGREVTEDDGGV